MSIQHTVVILIILYKMLIGQIVLCIVIHFMCNRSELDYALKNEIED